MNNATDYSPTKKIDMILLPSVDHHLSLIIANFAFLHYIDQHFCVSGSRLIKNSRMWYQKRKLKQKNGE